MSVTSIANQAVKGTAIRKKPSVSAETGSQVPASYGSTQGMKPAAFGTYKRIANQKVKSSGGPKPAKRALPKDLKFTPGKPATTNDDAKATESKSKAIVDTAKKRFDQAAEAEAEIRKEALDDLKFFSGDQWDETVRRDRQTDGRPCMTINRLPQFVRQVTNEQRQNRPAVQINPVDDGADPETAEIIQGLIRHVEYDSGADAAYDTAFFGAATYGFGYWVVTTEYSGPLSFELDIKIKRIRNPFTVYLDPNAKEPDFSDAEWGFIVTTMSKDAYKEAFGDSELSKTENWQSIGDSAPGWIQEDACRVVEYYWREREKDTLLMLRGGGTLLKSEVPEEFREFIKADVVQERPTEVTKVKWAKLNGVEVLDETDWAGRWIPIIKVVGDELDIDGELKLKGIVRDAKEPQRNFNFMKSAATEAIALAPKAPFVGAEGQFAGYEPQWKAANRKNFAFLQYKAVAINGTIVPPPQRMNAEPAIQAINMAMMESADDLKAVTGIYDAALGAQGNEQSGKAILARQQQSQGSNFHFIDNLTRAIRHSGRVILDLIPKIYDTWRVVRIIGMENDQKTVTINGQLDPSRAQLTPDQVQALEKVYDVTVGKYDVTISTGPSYQSRRQEAVSSILDLVKSFPQLMTMAGDILVGNMDWPGAKEIANRLKASLPPNLQNADEDSPLPPEVQQMLVQMHATVQQLQQELAAAQNDVQNDVSVKKLETDSKERIAAGDHRIKELELQIEAAKVDAQLVAALAKIDAMQAEQVARQAHDRMAQIAGERHAAALETMKHEQSMERAEQAAQHAAVASQQAEDQTDPQASGTNDSAGNFAQPS